MTSLELERKKIGKTQQEIAEKIGVSVSCYNMYENNQRKIPNEKAEKLVEVFNKKKEDIFLPANFTASEIIKMK